MIYNRLPGFLLIFAILIVWEFASAYHLINPVAFPRVSAVVQAWGEGIATGVIPAQLISSLGRIFAGFGLAVVVAIPLGLLMATIPFVYRLLEPLTEFLRPIPSSAYIPAAILFLGIGDTMKIFVVFLACLFPILLNTYSGVKNVDQVLVDTGRTFGLSALARLYRIMLPAALPSILTGMRISLGIALVVVVVAEMISGSSGIGYYILDMQRTFRVPSMFAGIFTIGVFGYLLNLGFLSVEGYFLRWQ